MAFGVASAATAEPGPVASKQAEAQSIISQISGIETELSTAVERWNNANVKLARIGDDLHRSRFELGVARVNLKHAQVALARQALSVYTSSDSNGTIEVLLGSSSLDDLLNRIDTVNRVNDQRSSVVGDVTTFRKNVARQTARLHRAHSEQRQIVAERLAEKQSIQSKLAERNRLLQSVRAEIVHLRAVEAARQAALARQLREQQAREALQPQVASIGTRCRCAPPRFRRRLRRRLRLRRLHRRRPSPPRRPRRTAASSASRCSTSGRPTCGAVRHPAGSTAPVS